MSPVFADFLILSPKMSPHFYFEKVVILAFLFEKHWLTSSSLPAVIPNCTATLNRVKQEIWHRDFSDWGHFWTRNFRYHWCFGTGYFGSWTFGHMDILAPCKVIWTFQHRQFGTGATMLKCPCTEMSLCPNVLVPKIPHAENSLCKKVPMSKFSCVEMSICQNVRSAELCACQNVLVMKLPCQNDSCWNIRSKMGGSLLIPLCFINFSSIFDLTKLKIWWCNLWMIQKMLAWTFKGIWNRYKVASYVIWDEIKI